MTSKLFGSKSINFNDAVALTQDGTIRLVAGLLKFFSGGSEKTVDPALIGGSSGLSDVKMKQIAIDVSIAGTTTHNHLLSTTPKWFAGSWVRSPAASTGDSFGVAMYDGTDITGITHGTKSDGTKFSEGSTGVGDIASCGGPTAVDKARIRIQNITPTTFDVNVQHDNSPAGNGVLQLVYGG
jgi:hypothetical protein